MRRTELVSYWAPPDQRPPITDIIAIFPYRSRPLFAARECSQEEGKEEGKEPSLGARERNQAVVRAVRPGRTTRVPHLRAQPAPGRLQVGTPIIGVNLGSLEPTPASTGTESRVRTRDSHCKHGVEKVCQGQSGPMPRGPAVESAERPSQTTTSELQVENRCQVTGGVAA